MASLAELEIELLGPAFVGGSEPRKVDPFFLLRPSEVRGHLRSWFRMAAASAFGPADSSDAAGRNFVAALRQIEGTLFGDTARRSPFDVLPVTGGRLVRYGADQVRQPDPRTAPGLRYLGYGVFDDKRPPEALVTDPGSHLKLRLRLRRTTPAIEKILGATLWLWLHLGGVGARSRRGFGSLRLCDAGRGVLWPLPPLRAVDRQAHLDGLIAGVDAAIAAIADVLPTLGMPPTGPSPHPQIRTLANLQTARALPQTFSSPEAALEQAGRMLQDFRSTLRRNARGVKPLPDYFGVKRFLQDGIPPRKVDRAAFGLPLNFFFRSLGNRKTQLLPDDGRDRLPSPLHLRVHALKIGYVLVFLHLAEEGDVMLGRTLTIEGQPVEPPDPDIITQFIAWASEETRRNAAPRPSAPRTGGRR